MLAVELINEETATQAMTKLFDNRLIVDQFLFNRSSFRIAPPLTITFDEIDEIVKTLIASLDQIINKKV